MKRRRGIEKCSEHSIKVLANVDSTRSADQSLADWHDQSCLFIDLNASE